MMLNSHARRAFTLIELLIAVAIFGIVLAAINTVFYSALHLRNRTTEVLELSQSVNQALTILRRDLQGAVPPGGLLAGAFKIGPVSIGTITAESEGIEFRTTTGTMSETAPWGDIQKVVYLLREPLIRSDSKGKDMVRCVTRNLLSTMTEEVVEQRLLNDVETLEFTGYNGTEWVSIWDTTQSDTNMPTAIRVRIQRATENPGDNVNRQPIELMVPLLVQSPNTTTNAVAQ